MREDLVRERKDGERKELGVQRRRLRHDGKGEAGNSR